MKTYALMIFAACAVGASATGYAADIVQDKYRKGYTIERFEKADVNGDGFLTLKEAAAASTKFEEKGGRRRFEAADTNGDGLLSRAEASARKDKEMKHGPGAAGKRHASQYNLARFQETDTDGDGYVTREEAAASANATDLLGGKRFDRADTNGDGRLSLEEATAQRAKERGAF